MPSFSPLKPKLSAVGFIGALCLALSLIGCSNKKSDNSAQSALKAVATSFAFSFVITDGKIYAAGDNEYGQLGLGDSGKGANGIAFTEVTSLKGKNITAIVAGGAHSLALAKNGKVYAAGFNEYGQLG
ncbi:MAG: hypothetical protein LBC09_00235, partial [Helicobacteraceae bacterium]|nr:hypothetical protein [Helicobacteraceae bacterium]